MTEYAWRCNCGAKVLHTDLTFVSETLQAHKFLGCSAHLPDKEVVLDEEVRHFILRKEKHDNS